MPNQKEKSIPKELEVKPIVHGFFYGYPHSALNLQGVSRIREALETHMSKVSGDYVLLQESAVTSRSDAVKMEKMIQDRGSADYFLYASMKAELRRTPSSQEMYKRKAQIKNSSVQKILDQNLLETIYIEPFFLGISLDELKSKRAFEIHFESQPAQNIKSTQKSWDEAGRHHGASMDSWRKGDFDTALKEFRRTIQLTGSASYLREKSVIEDVSGSFKNKKRQKKQSGFFLLFGTAHGTIFTALEKKLRYDREVKLDSNIKEEDNLALKVQAKLASNSQVSDQLCAQYILEGRLYTRLGQFFKESRQLNVLSDQFEDIDQILNAIAGGFTLNQIRDFCENKTDPLIIIKNHPLAAPIHANLP